MRVTHLHNEIKMIFVANLRKGILCKGCQKRIKFIHMHKICYTICQIESNLEGYRFLRGETIMNLQTWILVISQGCLWWNTNVLITLTINQLGVIKEVTSSVSDEQCMMNEDITHARSRCQEISAWVLWGFPFVWCKWPNSWVTLEFPYSLKLE